jgi:hypothetical protein
MSAMPLMRWDGTASRGSISKNMGRAAGHLRPWCVCKATYFEVTYNGTFGIPFEKSTHTPQHRAAHVEYSLEEVSDIGVPAVPLYRELKIVWMCVGRPWAKGLVAVWSLP